MKIKLNVTVKRKKLLQKWLYNAQITNTREDGTFHGMTKEETSIVKLMLKDIVHQMYDERG